MCRFAPSLFALLLISTMVCAADGPMERQTNDRQIIDLLARVHDQGAALFNAGDHAGCYRMFQGSLVTIKLVLPGDIQDAVERALGRAELEPVLSKRALLLHEVIEDVRKKLHPTAGKIELLPKPKAVGDDDPMKTIPGVPRPGEGNKNAGPMSEVPVFGAPEPPRAPAAPPGKNALDAPPPVISGVPTSTPKTGRPMPLPMDPTVPSNGPPTKAAEPLSVPPVPAAPPKKIELTPVPRPIDVPPSVPATNPAPTPLPPVPRSADLEPPPELKPRTPAVDPPPDLPTPTPKPADRPAGPTGTAMPTTPPATSPKPMDRPAPSNSPKPMDRPAPSNSPRSNEQPPLPLPNVKPTIPTTPIAPPPGAPEIVVPPPPLSLPAKPPEKKPDLAPPLLVPPSK